MASEKKTDESGTSLFKAAVISAPVAYGGYSFIKSGDAENLVNSFSDNLSSRSSFSSSLIRQSVNLNMGTDVFKRTQLDGIASKRHTVRIPLKDLKNLVTQAVLASDPSGHLYASLSPHLLTATDQAQVIESFTGVIGKNSSIYSAKAAGRFSELFNIMESRSARGLSTSFSAVSMSFTREIEKKYMSDFSPKMSGLLQNLMESISEPGRQGTVSITEFGRPDKPGTELRVKLYGGKLGIDKSEAITLKIPGIDPKNPSLITSGTTGQTKYIAGTYGIVEEGKVLSTYTSQEWMVKRANDELIPTLLREKVRSRRAYNSHVMQFTNKMMEDPEWIMSTPEGMHPGRDAYIKARSGLLHMYDSKYNKLNELYQASILEEGGLKVTPEFFGLGEKYSWNEFQKASSRFHLDRTAASTIFKQLKETGEGFLPVYPGFSPAQIAKSVVSLRDTRKDAFSLFSDEASWGRRPGQAIRANSSPTKIASTLMKKGSGTIDDLFSWAKSNRMVDAPMGLAMYVSEESAMGLQDLGLSAEGQYLVSERGYAARSVNKWRQFSIASDKVLSLGDYAKVEEGGNVFGLDSYKGSQMRMNVRVPEGTVLGLSPEGLPVKAPPNFTMKLVEGFKDDKSKGDFLRVVGHENVTNPSFFKGFGIGKGMWATSEQSVINETVSRVTKPGIKNEAVQMILTTAELKKNRVLHYNQMFTALWHFTRQNMNSGKVEQMAVEELLNNPLGVAKSIQDATAGDHPAKISRLIDLARTSNLTPRQMGLTFGAVPEAFGKDSASLLASLKPGEMEFVKQGNVVGAGQIFFEDVAGPGSGKMATIEPRAFQFLNSPHLGAVGPELQQDISNRMNAMYPERLLEQKELTRSLESLSSLKDIKGAHAARDVLKNPELLRTGGNVQLGDLGSVFVPGNNIVKSLAEYQTATGSIITSDLANSYNKTIEMSEMYSSGAISKDAMMKQVEALQVDVAKSRIGTITGKGGLLRNRVPGSVFLTSVAKTPKVEDWLERKGIDLLPGEVGITKKYAKKMFTSMENLGIYSTNELKAMSDRFMAGEGIAGLLGRHPYIGPYSNQPTTMKLIPGEEAVAMFNEQVRRAIVAPGSIGMDEFKGIMSSPASIKEVAKARGISETLLRSSPMVGLAGDFDGDIVSVMLGSPDMQKKLTTLQNDAAYKSAYESYSLRSQILKAKAPSGSLTLSAVMRNKMAADDALKLGITQSRLGKLSTALQGHRSAILSRMGRENSKQAMNALGLLEWMEQTPISGKHIKAGESRRMIGLFEDITKSFKSNDRAGIIKAVSSVLEEAKPVAKSALTEGVNVAIQEASGAVRYKKVRGIDIANAVDFMIESRKAMERTKANGVSMARLAEIFHSKGGRMTGTEAAATLSNDVVSMSPMSGFFKGTERKAEGFASRLVSSTNSFINKITAAGQKSIPHARKIGLGFAGAVGLATVLSSPTRSIGPGQLTPPSANLKSGSGGSKMGTNVHPSSETSGSPTVSDHTRYPNSARIAPHGGYNVSVSGDISGRPDEVASRLRSGMSGAGGHTMVTDNRSSLTARTLSNILENN